MEVTAAHLELLLSCSGRGTRRTSICLMYGTRIPTEAVEAGWIVLEGGYYILTEEGKRAKQEAQKKSPEVKFRVPS